jgi:hypothetical protein
MLEWVVGLNTYLRGTLDEKIACKSVIRGRKSVVIDFIFLVAFNCYSLKGEKHITREEIFQLLKSSVLKVSVKTVIDGIIHRYLFFSKLVMKIQMKVLKN